MNASAPPGRIVARFRHGFPGFALDVQLDVPARGVTALFGPSGSGKTTLLRCVAGLERAAGGYLSVDGAVWQDDARGVFLPTHRRPLGYVFQEASLFPHLDVRRNLEYGCKRLPRAERKVSLEHAVEMLGIEPLLDRMPDRLSGGERQRVAIARALAVSPRLLLMDEPLAALDQARKREILPYLERLHDALAIPVLYVSHAQEEVARIADHIVLLERGQVSAAGVLSEIVTRADLPLAHEDDAGAVLDVTVAEHDGQYHLSRLDFAGGGVWVRDALDDPIGHYARIRILARDVSLTLERQHDTSILNLLPAIVETVVPDRHPSQVLVTLRAGGVPLLCRITRKSADVLALRPGLQVWAQIKAVALLR